MAKYRRSMGAQRSIRVQQMPNPLGDDPRLAGSGPGNHQQRPLPMRNGAPLRLVHLQRAVQRFLACVAERWMTNVVYQRKRLRKVFVQAKREGDGAGDM